GEMAPRPGARSGSRAPNAAIIDTTKTAVAARLADRNVLPSCHPGRRRHLWLAPDEGRPGIVLDRRWHRARSVCRVAYHVGKTSLSVRQHGSRFTSQLDGRRG